LLSYHFGFKIEEIGKMSVYQFSSYLDNLGFILNPKQETGEEEPLDASNPEHRAEFERLLGIRKNA